MPHFKILSGGGWGAGGARKATVGGWVGVDMTGIPQNTSLDLWGQGERAAPQRSAEPCGQRGKGAWWAGWNCHMEEA